MKLYSIIIWRQMGAGKHPVSLVTTYELSSFGFFQRGSAKEVMCFASREVCQRTQPAARNSVKHQGHLIHAYVKPEGLGATAVTDEEYPQRVVFTLLRQVLDGFANTHAPSEWKAKTQDTELPCPQVGALLQKYQDPHAADDVLRMQNDLNETKDVLIQSIDQLLERGEKLETLMDKSDDLSFQSKTFLTQTEDMNKCCSIL